MQSLHLPRARWFLKVCCFYLCTDGLASQCTIQFLPTLHELQEIRCRRLYVNDIKWDFILQSNANVWRPSARTLLKRSCQPNGWKELSAGVLWWAWNGLFFREYKTESWRRWGGGRVLIGSRQLSPPPPEGRLELWDRVPYLEFLPPQPPFF